MHKSVLMTMLTLSIILLGSPAWAAETGVSSRSSGVKEIKDLTVTVGEQPVDFGDAFPVLINERTLVPLRAIFEAMGATVDWDSENRTIYASRKGRSIELFIDKSTALVDNQEILLEAPPIIFKERTLVPLRFIGEAFDGIVDWNSKTKTVAISLTQENVMELPDLQVEFNNKMLDFQTPPILKNGRNYIPLENILDAMDSETYWVRNGDEIAISIDGASVKLFTGKNYAVVNGKKVNTTDFPIEYQGNVLAPVRFLTEAFGGIAHFVPETKVTHIYINRPKFKTSFLVKEAKETIKPTPVPRASLADNRMLMVSDNPEILTPETIPSENVTLWHHTVDSSEVSLDHRIFGWHINHLGQKVKLGITIENLSEKNELEVVGLKGINRSSPNGWSNYDVGLPIAETVLSGQLLNVKLNVSLVQPGETLVLQSFEVEPDNLIGFLDEFTIKNAGGTGEMKYRIRTVLTQSDSDLAAIKSSPVGLDRENPHPRGNWNGSTISAEFPLYQVGSGEMAYSISNGITDNILSEEKNLDATGSVIGNPGHYGATYRIKIPIVNNTGEAKTVRIRIGGRGGLYAGAVKTKEGVFITPVLEPMKEVANVVDYEIQGNQDVIELEIMHAGGSALALAVDIITLD
ncbi:MAG: copper amine oxidase N-terminal domain-containing protein [Dehalobacterium sp.]